MDIFSLISLCGGLAFFLYGMSVMSSGLEKLAGGRLEQLLKNCTEQLTIGSQPSPENYAKQNRYLVDHADFLVAVSDGEGEMVGYARKKKMGILRIHPDTAAVDGDVWGDGA